MRLSDVTLYECIICGRAFTKVQSLRAHMKVHKGHDYVRTSIWVKGGQWEKFEALCKKHHTTTCHLLSTLVDAALKGEETGMVHIGAPNPVIINVSHTFLGSPRSAWKVPVSGFEEHVPHCPSCGSLKVRVFRPEFILGVLEGRCEGCGAEWFIHKAK